MLFCRQACGFAGKIPGQTSKANAIGSSNIGVVMGGGSSTSTYTSYLLYHLGTGVANTGTMAQGLNNGGNGFASSTKAYGEQGNPGSGNTSNVAAWTFSSSTNALVATAMPSGICRQSQCTNSDTTGYINAGVSTGNTAMSACCKMPFANETFATDTSLDANWNSGYGMGCHGWGYIGGGYNPGWTTADRKLDYSSGAWSSISALAYYAYQPASGSTYAEGIVFSCPNGNGGYGAGTTHIDFSSDAIASVSSLASVGDTGSNGMSNPTDCFVLGGQGCTTTTQDMKWSNKSYTTNTSLPGWNQYAACGNDQNGGLQ